MAVAEAGAFSVVIEAVAEPLGRRITQQVPIPTIGIGASAACDGQILVLEDMLGLSPRVPKFVKRYGDLGPGDRSRDRGLCRRGALARLPGPRARLPDAAKSPEINDFFVVEPMVSGGLLPCRRHIARRIRAASVGNRAARIGCRAGIICVSDIFQEVDEEVTARAAPEAVGPLPESHRRRRCPDRGRRRRLARLRMVGGQAGGRGRRRLRGGAEPQRRGQARRGARPPSPRSRPRACRLSHLARMRDAAELAPSAIRRRRSRPMSRLPPTARSGQRCRTSPAFAPVRCWSTQAASRGAHAARAARRRTAVPSATPRASCWRSPPGAPATRPAAKRWFDLIVTDVETPPATRARIEMLIALVAAGSGS